MQDFVLNALDLGEVHSFVTNDCDTVLNYVVSFTNNDEEAPIVFGAAVVDDNQVFFIIGSYRPELRQFTYAKFNSEDNYETSDGLTQWFYDKLTEGGWLTHPVPFAYYIDMLEECFELEE